MALQFILGAPGSGKSRLLFETCLKQAQAHPEKKFIVLVPEQFTLQTQRELVQLSERGGILNIDVLSFTRLAYRVFERTGAERRAVLSETGKSLLLRLIAAREASGLSLLSGMVDRPGVLAEIKSILSELDQYGITEQDLKAMQQDLEKEGGHTALVRKLEEVRLLRQAYETYQGETFITGEMLPRVLCEKAPQDAALKGCSFFLDGYNGFTPAQLEVLRVLFPLAERMVVTVTADPGEGELAQTGDVKAFAGDSFRDHDLFAVSRRTVRQLVEAAEASGSAVERAVVLTGEKGRLREGCALHYLEQNLFRTGARGPFSGPADGIYLRRCADAWDEVESAAVTVEELVRRGLRYRDIAVVCGSLKEYGEYARRIFTRYGIPFFIDRSFPAVMNPAFEMIQSAIAVLEQGFSYESILRLIRTGFVVDNAGGDADLLENYLRAAGIRGHRAWQQPFTRRTRRDDAALRETAERLRAGFMEHFEPFATVLKKGRAPLKEYAGAVWDLLVAFEVPGALARMSRKAQERGDAVRREEYSQVLEVICRTLDEAALLIGDEVVTRRQFSDILTAGFSEAKIGLIPPGIDEVHVGDFTRTRLDHVQVVLCLGMNDGLVPERRKRGAVLTDMERELLRGRRMQLSPTAREDANIQQFQIYLALTRPARALILSWSAAARSGEVLRPAYVTQRVAELFPNAAYLPSALSDPFGSVTSLRSGRQVLALQLSEYACADAKAQKEMEGKLKELLGLYADDRAAQILLQEAVRGRIPQDLAPEQARALYGSIPEGSITRLEEFAQCPFRHFADYGLRLREREEFSLEAPDIGTTLHAAMEAFSDRVHHSRDYTWDTLPDALRDAWARECIEQAAERSGRELYDDTARSRGIFARMVKILQRSVRTLQHQVRSGLFEPAAFEVSFGKNSGIEAVRVDLPGKGQMRLSGRIDRIDLSEDQKSRTLYVRVVDYKSGSRTPDLDQIIDGEQLQLMVYLDAAAQLEQKAHPDKKVVCAGVFYYRLQDPVIDWEKAEGDAEKGQALSMRMSGLVNGDPGAMMRMDKTLLPGQSSDVVPVRLNKDGTPSASSAAVVSGKQLELLMRYTKERMKKSAGDMLEGAIRPHPVRRGQHTACDWCPYGDVCRFDPRAVGMRYQERTTREKDERWELIREVVEDAEGEREACRRSDGQKNSCR